MLVCEGLSYGYERGRPVLTGVSLSLEAGKVTAILGPNGAGKSTLLRLLIGAASPWTGSVRLEGRALMGMDRRVRARAAAYVAQRGGVAFPFTVREVVRLGRYGVEDQSRDGVCVEAALERFALHEVAQTPVGALSAGQQQRVSMARAWAQLGFDGHGIAPEARAILLDEPVSAMDPAHGLEAMGALAELAELGTRNGAGVAVGVVLHDMSLVLRFAHRAVVMHCGGTVAAGGTVEEVVTPRVLGPVYGVEFGELVDERGRVGGLKAESLNRKA